jgi:hypothetical protein
MLSVKISPGPYLIGNPITDSIDVMNDGPGRAPDVTLGPSFGVVVVPHPDRVRLGHVIEQECRRGMQRARR